MRRAGPCPRERCAAPQARARSRRGGAVGARETADGGTFVANGAQHSRAKHRPVCQAAYDELEHARRVWVRLTQGRAGTLRRTGWRHYQDLGRSYASLPGYLHGSCGRSPWRRNGARSPAYHAEPGVGQRCSRVGGRTQNHPDLHSSLSCLPGSRRRTELAGSGAPGCQSPSVPNLAASGQPLMTAACPCPGCYCEYLTAAARIAGSSSRYARSATSPGRPHKPGMMRACRWIGHLP